MQKESKGKYPEILREREKVVSIDATQIRYDVLIT